MTTKHDDHDVQLVQIIEATSWYAIYDNEAMRRVVCWGMYECRTHKTRYVVALVDNGPEIAEAPSLKGYLGNAHGDDLEDVGEE